jgi:hypothetical protein
VVLSLAVVPSETVVSDSSELLLGDNSSVDLEEPKTAFKMFQRFFEGIGASGRAFVFAEILFDT